MPRQFYVNITGKSGGANWMGTWGSRLVEVTITDERGEESDKLSVELDDLDGQAQTPEFGDILTVKGGYVGEPGSVGGEFEVDQIDLDGWPQKVVVGATTVSAKKDTKDRKTEAHKKEDTKTLGDLMSKIAKRNGWTPKIDSKLAKIPIKYEGQTAEFDTQFATRVAKKYGGQVSIKHGNMVVTKPGSGKTASGQTLPPLVVQRGVNLLDYHCSLKKRPDHKKVQAHTFDRSDVKKVDVDTGKGEITYKFREPFKDKDEAKAAAESKLSELSRSKGSVTFEIEGDVTASAERPVKAIRIRRLVDGDWSTTRATHKFNDKYTTTVECEIPGTEDDDKGDKDEEK